MKIFNALIIVFFAIPLFLSIPAATAEVDQPKKPIVQLKLGVIPFSFGAIYFHDSSNVYFGYSPEHITSVALGTALTLEDRRFDHFRYGGHLEYISSWGRRSMADPFENRIEPHYNIFRLLAQLGQEFKIGSRFELGYRFGLGLLVNFPVKYHSDNAYSDDEDLFLYFLGLATRATITMALKLNSKIGLYLDSSYSYDLFKVNLNGDNSKKETAGAGFTFPIEFGVRIFI